jgi:hypothetical protein
MFRVLVNWAEVHPVASGDDADRLCGLLAGLPAFTAHATGPAGEGSPALDVVVESGRAAVSLLDIGRGVKLASRNPDCPSRDIVSLANDDYPELQLDQIEVERRGLIPPSGAVAILRHFLLTGEPIDLVPWPPDDWVDRPAAPESQPPQGEDIPF